MVRCKGKSLNQKQKHTTKTKPKTKATRKSPSQICVSPQINDSEATQNGAGPNKNDHSDLPWDTVTLATVSTSKTCKLILYCGSPRNIVQIQVGCFASRKQSSPVTQAPDNVVRQKSLCLTTDKHCHLLLVTVDSVASSVSKGNPVSVVIILPQ